MASRARSYNGRVTVSGTRFHRIYYNPAKTVTTDVGPAGTCTDVVGNREGANPFDLRYENRECAFLNGQRSDSGGLLNQYSGVPIASFPALDPDSQYAAVTQSAANNWGLEILQRTNISNADISLPTFIGELRDLPSLVHDWGGNLLRRSAKGYISWRWAVAPMVGDLRKLCNFTAQVDRRVKLLKGLQEKGFTRKRVGLRQRETTTTPSSTFIYSDVAMVVSCPRSVYYTEKVWGSTMWKLMSGVKLPSDAASLRKQAIGLTYGITSYEALATLWELTPWSWFVDWFADVGGFIKAYNGTIPCQSTRTCVMQTTTARAIYGAYTGVPNWASISGRPEQVVIRKRRLVSTPTSFPLLNLPFLDGGKWAILGSLAALRDPANRTRSARRR